MVLWVNICYLDTGDLLFETFFCVGLCFAFFIYFSMWREIYIMSKKYTQREYLSCAEVMESFKSN